MCVMNGAGVLGAFPQNHSLPFLCGDDAGLPRARRRASYFRKGFVMLTTLKLFGLSVALACGTCFGVCDAQACGGGRCGGCAVQSRCCAPTCAAPASAMPAHAPATDAPPPPVEPKAAVEGRQRYQSAYQAPGNAPMQSYGSRSSSDQFGASRKLLGRFGN